MKPASFRRRWRGPIVLSVFAHVAGVALFYACSDKLGGMPDNDRFSVEAQPKDAEEEEDVLVMDIGTPAPPAPVVPTVEAPAARPPQSRVDSAATTSPTPLAPMIPPSGASGSVAAARPGAAAATTTAFFDVATQAHSVVYVIDRSGSMGASGRLALARHELLASLDRLPATACFQIIPYNRVAEPLRIAGHSDLVAATAENKQQAALLMEGLLPEGGTEHLAALTQALLLQPEAIYFLTDADDLLPDQVRTLTKLNHGRATIHAIELTKTNRNAADMPLHVLARENRGEYRGVDVP